MTAWPLRARDRLANIVSLLALCGCSAATDLFKPPPIPPQSPGTIVLGPGSINASLISRPGWSVTWAPDGKALYLLARPALTSTPDTSATLMAVDPTTGLALPVASIPLPGSMVVTPDGSALLYAAGQDSLEKGLTIYRLPVSGADTPTVVVRAGSSNMVVSPDGTTLLYHTLGSSTFSDTIAALNLASGLITSRTAAQGLHATSFSSDGTQVALLTDTVESFVYIGRAGIWNIATGSVTILQMPSGMTSLPDVEWARGAFRAFGSGPAGYFEFAIATGVVTSFGSPDGVTGGAVAWARSRGLMLTGFTDGTEYAYGEESHILHYSLRAVQPGGVQDAEFGSINLFPGTTIKPFVPSPDGKWLAYGAANSVYLLAIP